MGLTITHVTEKNVEAIVCDNPPIKGMTVESDVINPLSALSRVLCDDESVNTPRTGGYGAKPAIYNLNNILSICIESIFRLTV